MEVSYLENLQFLRIKLEKSIDECDPIERQAVITDLKNICFDAKLKTSLSDSRIVSFNEMRCNKNCEECILYGHNYFISNIDTKW